MTPQLQQAIRLLQLSTIDLQAEVQDALDSNLMLESADEEGGEAPTVLEPAATPLEETGEQAGEPKESNVQEKALDMEPDGIPDDLPVDSAWEDIYDGAVFPVRHAEPEEMEFESQRHQDQSLAEHLQWQLMMTPFSDTDHAIGAAIIDAVDEKGYLNGNLEDIRESMGGDIQVELDEVEAVLHRIQMFDPPGVAARDLRDCLLIQLRQLDPDIPWVAQAITLVDEHLEFLAGRDYNQLMRRLKLKLDDLREVIGVIQRMNPRPGSQISSTETEFIIPDVFVRKQKGAWHVELNPESMPRVRINPYYAGLVRRADNSADNNTLKAHLQEARWFLKSLRSRSETLLKVASTIVARQRGFLEHGEEAMKPMVLHDVADIVNMHESTISRVTTRKYMHTPRGVYELKYFFSSHVSTESGGECSSTAIRALIKKLITAESPVKPLSDNKIAMILSQEGINVARRTVAKYREAMAISSSNERKRLA